MEPSDNNEEPAEKKFCETEEQNTRLSKTKSLDDKENQHERAHSKGNSTAIEGAEIEVETASDGDNAVEFETFKLKMLRYIAALVKYNNAHVEKGKEASILEEKPFFLKKCKVFEAFV